MHNFSEIPVLQNQTWNGLFYWVLRKLARACSKVCSSGGLKLAPALPRQLSFDPAAYPCSEFEKTVYSYVPRATPVRTCKDTSTVAGDSNISCDTSKVFQCSCICIKFSQFVPCSPAALQIKAPRLQVYPLPLTTTGGIDSHWVVFLSPAKETRTIVRITEKIELHIIGTCSIWLAVATASFWYIPTQMFTIRLQSVCTWFWLQHIQSCIQRISNSRK